MFTVHLDDEPTFCSTRRIFNLRLAPLDGTLTTLKVGDSSLEDGCQSLQFGLSH